MDILVIEDEKKVAAFLKRGLEEQNYKTEIAYNGSSGLDLAIKNNYQVIILDINIPEMNGIDLCLKLRKHKSTPILMLTALGALEDKIVGLDSGADDYLVKPFEFRELLARIKALGRRNTPTAEQHLLQVGDLVLNNISKEVKRSNVTIELTAKEYYLLAYLMKNAGKVLTRSEIAEHVWNVNFDTGTNIIDVYINYLRKKIDRDFSPKLIHTLVGIGYTLKAEE